MKSLSQYVNCSGVQKKVDKAWGWEEWIVNNEEYCGKRLFIKKGAKFSMHFHRFKHETFYVVHGYCQLTLIDTTDARRETFPLVAGNSATINRFMPHQIEALDDTLLIEFSTTHLDSDSYRVEPGDSQKAPEYPEGSRYNSSNKTGIVYTNQAPPFPYSDLK